MHANTPAAFALAPPRARERSKAWQRWADRIKPAWVGICSALLLITHVDAQSVVVPLSPSLASPPAPPPPRADETLLYLEVSLNGEPTEAIIAFHQREDQLLVSRADLAQLDIRMEQLTGNTRGTAQPELISLDQIAEMTYHFDAAKQTIDLVLSDRLRKPKLLGSSSDALTTWASSSGMVMNYDAYFAADPKRLSNSALSIASEQRLFSRLGIVDNTGVAHIGAASLPPYLRLATAWHFDDPQTLTTAQAGDLIGSSLTWSRAVRFGGLQFRRNFELRPDLITFPLPQLAGSAAVPSAVDVYINNVRQFSDQVPSGPFVINNPLALTGSGQARVVVRDELGREVSTTLPIYVDNRMLANGLDAYSLEAGVLRRSYGLRSFDYGDMPAVSGSYRRGLSDWLTLELHDEVATRVVNGGAGALLRLGQLGVVNGAVSASAIGGVGGQFNLGYQWVLPRLSLSAQTTRNYGRYRDLAAIDASVPPRAFDQISLSVPLWRNQSVGASYIHTSMASSFLTPAVNGVGSNQTSASLGRSNDNSSQLLSLSYTAQPFRHCSLFGNAYRDLDRSNSYGVYLGVSFDLGHRMVGFVNGGRTQGQNNGGVSLSKTADYDGGWEWALQDNENSLASSRLARGGYLGRYGEVGAAAQQQAQQTTLSLDASGGIVFMDGVLEPSRHIYDSFALVSTGGIAGIPVLNENRTIGNTDRSGHLLIPDLNSYQRNRLAIDSMVLPVDASVPVSHLDVVPRGQSGVLARFDIRRYSAATIILVDAAGAVIPAGTLVRHRESAHDSVIGYDGQTFVEDLQAHNHLDIALSTLHCIASFDYHETPQSKARLQTIGPVVCAAQ